MELKIVFVGQTGCGKITLIAKILSNKWVKDAFDVHYYDEDTFNHSIILDDKKIKLELKKSNFHEEYASISFLHINQASFPVFVFTVTSKSSLTTVEEIIQRYYKMKEIDNPLFILLGLKTDLERIVYPEDIERVLKLSKNSKYMEFSSKVDETQNNLVLEMIQFYLDYQNNEKKRLNDLTKQKNPVNKGLFSSISSQNEAQEDIDRFNSLK